jgi:hypothetical protein
MLGSGRKWNKNTNGLIGLRERKRIFVSAGVISPSASVSLASPLVPVQKSIAIERLRGFAKAHGPVNNLSIRVGLV